MFIREEYYHIKGTPTVTETIPYEHVENYIRVSLRYVKDPWATKPRGYYMSLESVGRGKLEGGYWESYGLLSENKRKTIQVLTCTRKTKKNEAEALKFFEDNKLVFLQRLYGDAVEMEKEVM